MTRLSPVLRVFLSAAIALAAGWPGAGVVRAQDVDASPHAPAQRWSGSGRLERAATQVGAEGRFVLEARVHTAPPSASIDATQRFALRARLSAPKGLPAACAAINDRVFSDGFE